MMTNLGNRVTQGQFSFLPDLTDEQITAQIKYALKNGWAVSVEYTDDPHPRNTYWEMFGMPMFDLKDPAGILMEINNCRKTFPNYYIRVTAFDSSRGVESAEACRTSSTGPRSSPASGCRARKDRAGRSITRCTAMPPTSRKANATDGVDQTGGGSLPPVTP